MPKSSGYNPEDHKQGRALGGKIRELRDALRELAPRLPEIRPLLATFERADEIFNRALNRSLDAESAAYTKAYKAERKSKQA